MNIPKSELQLRNELRDKLAKEVANFCLDGNKIDEIPFGESHFKDGVIPISTENIKLNTPLKSKSRPKAKPKVKPKVKPKTAVTPKKSIVTKPRSAKKNSYSPSEVARRKHISDEKIKAITEGRMEFQAVCKLHSDVTYVICGELFARCSICIKEARIRRKNRSQETIDCKNANSERLLKNKTALEQAATKGEKNFLGDCLNCGPSEFLIRLVNRKRTDGSIKEIHHPICISCKNEHEKAFEEKKKQQKQIEVAA